MGIAAASFSPDGKVLITGSAEGDLCEWDPETGTKRHVLVDPAGEDDAAPRVVLVDGDGREEEAPFRLVPLSSAIRGSAIRCVCFAPDGSRFVAGAANGRVVVWNARSRGALCQWLAHDDNASAACVSPDGRLLATGTRTDGYRTLRVWSLAGLKGGVVPDEVFWDDTHVGGVSSVSFSADGRHLAAGGYTYSGYTGPLLYDVGQWSRVGTFYWDVTSALQWSPDGRTLATGSDDGRFSLWDVERREGTFGDDAHRGLVGVVQFSPDGSLVASGDEAGGVCVWRVSPGARVAKWDFPGAVRALWFDPDRRRLLVADAEPLASRPGVHVRTY